MTVNRSDFLTGVMLALLGAVCFSTKAIFVKLAYRDTGIDSVTLLALRMIFSLPFFAGSAFVSSAKSSNVPFTRSQWLWIAFVGCLGYYISSLLDFIGLQFVTAGLERLILFVYPTLVCIMSAVWFKAKINTIQWIALVITYAGLTTAFLSEADLWSDQNENLVYGAVCVFICAITYASYIVGSGKLIPIVGASKFNSYAMSFACIAVLAHYFVSGSVQQLMNLSPMAYTYSILMAILGTVIPSYLVTGGMKRIGADNTAIIGSIGPVSTLLMAYWFLGESFSTGQLFGTALILVGVTLIGRQKS
ncbi:MAG: DMT family transporter [Bacteroidetes bacterium]|nr:DMT family transporter [Bacteroidota bacterium]